MPGRPRSRRWASRRSANHAPSTRTSTHPCERSGLLFVVRIGFLYGRIEAVIPGCYSLFGVWGLHENISPPQHENISPPLPGCGFVHGTQLRVKSLWSSYVIPRGGVSPDIFFVGWGLGPEHANISSPLRGFGFVICWLGLHA